MNCFAIRCVNDKSLMWSNTFGWTDCGDFDIFTEEEAESFNLPMEGEWVLMSHK